MEQRKSRVINSNEFFKYLWKKKLPALLIVVLCIILVCAYYYVSHKTGIEGIRISSDEEYEKIYSNLSKGEKVKLDLALKDYALYENSLAMMENSILMKINPYNAKQVNLQYAIKVDDKTENAVRYIDHLTTQYVQYVLSGSLSSKVANDIGYDESALNAIIDVVYNQNNLNSGVFTITILGTEMVDGLSEAVKTAIEDFQPDFETTGIKNELTLISEDVTYIQSSEFFEKQELYENERPLIKSRLNQELTDLTSDAFDCYEYKTSLNRQDSYTEGSINNVSAGISISGLIKYAFVGLIVGLILSIVIFLIRFQYSKKIIAQTDYTQTMGLNIISRVKDIESDDIKIACAKISSYCLKNSINKLAVITCSESVYGRLQNESGRLCKELAESGVDPVIIPEVCTNSQSMTQLFDIGHVVLIEKREDSAFKTVYDEVALCRENGVNLVGVIDEL